MLAITMITKSVWMAPGMSQRETDNSSNHLTQHLQHGPSKLNSLLIHQTLFPTTLPRSQSSHTMSLCSNMMFLTQPPSPYLPKIMFLKSIPTPASFSSSVEGNMIQKIGNLSDLQYLPNPNNYPLLHPTTYSTSILVRSLLAVFSIQS